MVSPNTSWVFSFILMFLVELTSFPASTASSADSFKLVLNSTDGRPLCAVNQPDNVFTFDGSNQIWNSVPSCLQIRFSAVGCAGRTPAARPSTIARVPDDANFSRLHRRYTMYPVPGESNLLLLYKISYVSTNVNK